MRVYILILLNILAVITKAQDIQLQAIALYNKAEISFEAADYQEAYANLEEAEKILDTTNSKILYLKINTLNHLAEINYNYLLKLDENIITFFKITDANTYPQEKYLDVINIQMDWKKKKEQEQKDFNALGTNPDSKTAMFFLEKYKWTPHKDSFNTLIEKAKKEEAKREELKQAELAKSLNNFEKVGRKSYSYENKIVNFKRMQEIMDKQKDNEISTLMRQARRAKSGRFIGFCALPLGVAALFCFASEEQAVGTILSFATVGVLVLDLGFTKKGNKKMKKAIKLYNERY